MAGKLAAVLGTGQTKYVAKRQDVSMNGLVREAIDRALADSGSTFDDIDAVVVGKAPDFFEGVMMPELFMADAMGATGKPLIRVHTAGSVGGSTGVVAASLVQSGKYRRVLALAWEKQSESNAMWALSIPVPFTKPVGAGAGGYFAPHVRAYIRRSGAPAHIGAMVAVKDRLNGSRNPLAHLQQPDITLEKVMASQMLWDPIRFDETCPSSDGACAVVVGDEEIADARGRHILGLGVSGPQVVEGWYGQRFPKPLARTREYIDIVRQVWARESPVTSAGPHYRLPLTGEGTTGLGKALKPITHPLRADIPIMLGAEGPKNVALAAEICDGWLPIFYSPRMAGMYNEWLDEGFARPGARRSREDFEICATAQVVITDDRAAAFAGIKPFLALYMGGMGAEETNFHADVYRRMGYTQVVDEVTKLFRSGRKDEAAEIIPDELVDDAVIVGDIDHVRKQMAVWEAAGVTMMVVTAGSAEQVRDLAALV